MTQAPAASPLSPLTLRGDLTEPLNRWLFLIKWLLIVPHLVVLIFLWIGLIFSWLFSMFAILFTGRYPRGLFNYNLGVMRWTWRVGFYSYQALGTDRYPPFSLQKDDAYPADLDVPYPERLSQGRVLIKWWLLALPHWIVVAVLQGVGARFGGVQFALVVFAGFGNLFNAKYPGDIWDFIMAINRWVYRFNTYVLLMTDKYPPFNIRE
jgi:hypothetical protein